jgi:hypothetical protein
MRQQNRRRQDDRECGRYLLANNWYYIRAKPVATLNSSPSAEGSRDNNGTVMPIKSLNTDGCSHQIGVTGPG